MPSCLAGCAEGLAGVGCGCDAYFEMAEEVCASGRSADSGTAIHQVAGGGAIPTRSLHVRRIPRHVAHAFLIEHHYLHTCPAQDRVCLGIFVSDALDAPMIGAMKWGNPIAANLFRDGHELMELSRMFILDVTKANAESRVLGYAARYIRRAFPWVRALIAYSDIEGMGHTGTIYRAAGWVVDAEIKAVSWKKHPKGHLARDRGSNTRKLRWRKELRR